MFTGIIEEIAKVKRVEPMDQSICLVLEKPVSFDDLSVGDSIACNGVCLTVEKFSAQDIQFCIGHETLQVTGWITEQLKTKKFNLERSMTYGQRIHGHLVSGHVDTIAKVVGLTKLGECLVLDFKKPKDQGKEIWKKSSVTINGVSLTVNAIDDNGTFQVCLVPETLRKTQLGDLQVGDFVNIETDYYMKGLLAVREETNA